LCGGFVTDVQNYILNDTRPATDIITHSSQLLIENSKFLTQQFSVLTSRKNKTCQETNQRVYSGILFIPKSGIGYWYRSFAREFNRSIDTKI
jgi:hypothetical protein